MKIFDSGNNVSGIFMSLENRQHLAGTVEMLGVKCFCLPFYMLSIVTAGLWYLIFLTVFLFTRITGSYLFCNPFLLGHSSWFGHVLHESRFSCRGWLSFCIKPRSLQFLAVWITYCLGWCYCCKSSNAQSFGREIRGYGFPIERWWSPPLARVTEELL